MKKNSVTASQLIEALKSIPCDAEVYLFCGHHHGPLNAISLVANSSTALTPNLPKQTQIHTYVSLSCRNPVDEMNPDGEPEPQANPKWN